MDHSHNQCRQVSATIRNKGSSNKLHQRVILADSCKGKLATKVAAKHKPF
jgi:hypothetical protein